MAGDFGLDFMEFSCLFCLLKEQINVEIPQLTIRNSACVFIGKLSVVPQLFWRMPPLAHFKTLLAFLVCELIFVIGVLEKSSRGYLNGKWRPRGDKILLWEYERIYGWEDQVGPCRQNSFSWNQRWAYEKFDMIGGKSFLRCHTLWSCFDFLLIFLDSYGNG